MMADVVACKQALRLVTTLGIIAVHVGQGDEGRGADQRVACTGQDALHDINQLLLLHHDPQGFALTHIHDVDGVEGRVGVQVSQAQHAGHHAQVTQTLLELRDPADPAQYACRGLCLGVAGLQEATQCRHSAQPEHLLVRGPSQLRVQVADTDEQAGQQRAQQRHVRAVHHTLDGSHQAGAEVHRLAASITRCCRSDDLGKTNTGSRRQAPLAVQATHQALRMT
mmetsp:Transcript_29161/g.64447  ORF Transcript_29161/g.64447 Transcript_29161/m.64447 type:complete len:224 (-) Transcript_29161:372-1043(-)